jgi:hypothetical protein
MTRALLQVVGLEVGDGGPSPLSFEVRRGEIHSLLFPPEVDRRPLLRVLGGLERPRAGRIDTPSGPVRVAMSAPGSTVADVLRIVDAVGSMFDVVLIDDAPGPANDRPIDQSWTRLTGQRARGATIVVATSREEQAYRSDRVSFAMWGEPDLRRAAVLKHSERMGMLATEFLRLLEASKVAPTADVAASLRRLNLAARDVLREAGKSSN